ncbi:MAG: hypothetical protein IT521_16560 [Burkholderiales bacterium]|nr:hypothetical protein [Burkholderiales bacterium]
MNSPSAWETPAEQLRYAKLLGLGARLGVVVTIAAFAAYAIGILPTDVSFARIPELMRMSLEDYLAATGRPTGWGWLAQIRNGEYASLAGIAILASCSLLPLPVIILHYARRRDWIFVIVCTLQIGILLLAASGALTAGH